MGKKIQKKNSFSPTKRSFSYYFLDGLPEAIIFAQVLGLISALVLNIYGNTGDTGETFAISFIFANCMWISTKAIGALLYSRFYSWNSNQKIIHILLWGLAIIFGSVLASQTAVGLSVLIFDSWLPAPFTWDNFILLGANLLLTLTFFFIALMYILKKRRLKQKIIENQQILHLQTQSKLIALQSKINPHFLFNTLNTMLNLVHKRPDKVENMILNLSDIYRKVLQYPEDKKIPLKEELLLVEKYLQIEKIRMGERLKYEIKSDPETDKCPIPPLLIEPLVENAIIHGISSKPKGGELKVRIKKINNKIEVTVADNGSGIENAGQKAGFGLFSVQERLRLIYKDRAGFEINETKIGGVTVKMEIPCED